MKNYKAIPFALVMGTAMMFMTGCENSDTFTYGEAVPFRCVSESHGARAAYSGVLDGGMERINWVDGDLVRIYCTKASKPNNRYADYEISHVTADGSSSGAEINKSGTDELCWGEDTHTFYGVYPSPSASGSHVSAIEDKKVTATVNANQNGDGRFSDGMVMVAKNIVSSPAAFDNSAVFLNFQPLTTAIKFSIKNGQSSAFNVKKVELKSTNHPLSGVFSYNIGEGKVQDESVTDAEKMVTITPASTVTLAANKGGDAYEITFLLRPDDDLDDLSIVVTPDGGEPYTSKLQTAEGPYTFERGTKTVINGVVLEKTLTLMSITPLGLGLELRGDGNVEEEILF